MRCKELQNQINTNQNETLLYHRSCCDATNKNKNKRDLNIFQKGLVPCPLLRILQDSLEQQLYHMTKNCFFCQAYSEEKGQSRLNEVETKETGVKISEAIKKDDSDVLKVRLSNGIQTEDAKAADFKSHLLCYVKHVENKIRKNDLNRTDDKALRK